MKKRLYPHNSRTYFDILRPLQDRYPHVDPWMFEENARTYATLAELINNVATDILDPHSRESAYSFAAEHDYDPSEADGATVDLEVRLSDPIEKTIEKGHQFAGVSPADGLLNIYEAVDRVTSDGLQTFSVPTKQKATQTGVRLGRVDVATEFLEMPVDGFQGIIRDEITLKIGPDTWTRVRNFDESTPTSRHFRLLYQSRGKVRIQFGNGERGLLPDVGSEVFATFAITRGTVGRMPQNAITIDMAGDPDIESVANPLDSSGGADAESVASIIRNASQGVRLRNVVFTQEDLEAAALQHSPSNQKAHGIPGVGSATIHIVPAGGGTPATGLLSSTSDYVQERTLFGAVPIVASAPNYNITDITFEQSVRAGFDAARVLQVTEFALTLATCAFDNQVLEAEAELGIDRCRIDLINSIWSWNFSAEENTALAFAISLWRELLGEREYRRWGDPMEIGDLWYIGRQMDEIGSDVFNLTSPTTNSIVGEHEIVSTGTVTGALA